MSRTDVGEPRQEVDPARQVRSFRDAITFAGHLPGIDAGRQARFAGAEPDEDPGGQRGSGGAGGAARR